MICFHPLCKSHRLKLFNIFRYQCKLKKNGNSGEPKDIVDMNANTLHPFIVSGCTDGQWNVTISMLDNYKCTRKLTFAIHVMLHNII